MKTFTVNPEAFEEHGAVRKAWSGTLIDHPLKGALPRINPPLPLGGKKYTVTTMGLDFAEASELVPIDTAPKPSENKATAPRRVGLVVTYRGKFYRIGAQVRVQAGAGGAAAELDESEPQPAPQFVKGTGGAAAARVDGHQAGGATGRAPSPAPSPPTPESFACIQCGGPALRDGIRCEACSDQHLREVRERVLAERAQRVPSPTIPGAWVVPTATDFAKPGAPCRTCAGTGTRTNSPAGAYEQIYTASCFNCGGAGVEPGLAQIETSQIDPNPRNPRRDFDETRIAELAASIREHGIIEPLVVTAQPDGRFLLISGERRLMAAGVAQLTRVPCLIRRPVEGAQQLALMLVENLQREDLNPIEEARAFRDLRDLGWKQTAIAEAAGKSQPRVAQSLALLDLPEPVQALASAGQLSFAHARTLTRFAAFPAVCQFIAEKAVQNNLTSKSLERDTLPYNYELHKAGFVQEMYASQVAFDMKAGCGSCPWQAFRSNGPYAGYCLKPEHYHELQKAGLEAQNAERLVAAREAQEQLRRQQAEIQRRREEENLAGAKGGAVMNPEGALISIPDPEPEPIPETPEEIAAAIAALPRFESLPKGEAILLNAYDTPKACSPACPCRAMALDAYGRAIPICTQPKRLKGLKREEAAREKQKRLTQLDALWTRALAAIGRTEGGQVHVMNPRAIAVLIQDRFQRHPKQRVAEALLALGLLDLDAGLLTQYRYQGYEPAWEALSTLPAEQQLRLLLLCVLEDERFGAVEYGHDRLPILHWLAGTTPAKAPAPLYTCATCGAIVEQEAVGQDLAENDWESETMCGDCYDRLLEEGKIDAEGNWLTAPIETPEEIPAAAANEGETGSA